MYLENEAIPEQMLVELAYNFKEMTFEAGSVLMNVDDVCQAMFIVRDGMVEILTRMDNEKDFPIEYLRQGSSINSNAFLVNDNLDVQARCPIKTTLYMLETDDFYNTIEKFPEVSELIRDTLNETIGQKENAIALDYVPGSNEFVYNDKVLYGKDTLHVHRISLMLKNAIMYYIVRFREERKVPKLKDILQ